MNSRKICFVAMGNLYLCPYISKYIENLDNDFDIIYWNRDRINEEIRATNIYSFDFELKTTDSKLKKLIGYYEFKKYAHRILKKNSYDGVILLSTIAGIVLQQILRKKYFKKFILDIRDYTLEENKIFYSIEKKLINDSAMTIISSEGYKQFLPKSNYIVTHNNRKLNNKMVDNIRNREKVKDKLVIAFIGFVNYEEQNKKLLKLFKNDKRFEIRFIGKEAEKLIPFCKENNINNVEIRGKFPSEKILDYYQNVDIIHNLYGNNTPTLDYALSNKLYFAAQLYMPILVCKDTFMEEISVGSGFGFSFNFNDKEICNKLYDYYQNIDWEVFGDKCNIFINKVEKDNYEFTESIRTFIEGEKND